MAHEIEDAAHEPWISLEPRSITVDERRRVLDIADEKPSIDLEIPFRRLRQRAKALSNKVSALRHGLDVTELTKSPNAGTPDLFNLSSSHELYATLLGSVETLIKDKRHLLIVPTGALTALPFHLLVTETVGRVGESPGAYCDALPRSGGLTGRPHSGRPAWYPAATRDIYATYRSGYHLQQSQAAIGFPGLGCVVLDIASFPATGRR